MAREIGRSDPAFPIVPAEFERAYPVDSYESFMRWWQFIDPIEGDLNHFHPILSRHIAHLKAQNVVYAEVMIAAGEMPADKGEAVDKVARLRALVDQWEADSIQIEFLIAFGRNKPPDRVRSIAARILRLHEAGLIVGVALAGPEPGYPVKPFQKTFASFHEAGLGIEIHAGEWCGAKSVWDAIEYGYPDRIGHGVSLFDDPRLIAAIRERNIHIEMCPTSNLKTGSITRIEDHPIGRARELGLSFSVNTDDPGIFGCSMAGEYELLANVFGFGVDDFGRMYRNALEARFQPELRVAATATQD